MAEGSAYALSIELQIKGNLQQQLQAVNKSIDGIEIKLQKVVESLGKSLGSLASGVADSTKQINKAVAGIKVSDVTEAIGDLNTANKAVGVSAAEVSTQVAKAGQNYSLAAEQADKLQQAIAQASALDFSSSIDSINESVSALKALQINVARLEEERAEKAARGITLDANSADLLKKGQNVLYNNLQKQKTLEISIDKLRTKWRKTNKTDITQAILSKKAISKMDSDELALAQDYIKQQYALNAAKLATGKLDDKTQKSLAGQNAALKNLSGHIEEVGSSKEDIKKLQEQFRNFADTTRSVMTAAGMGGLAKLTTSAGFLEAGIDRAMKRQEKFHELQYRGIGTMREMSTAIRKTADGSEALTKEIEDATTEMRNFGATKEDIEGNVVAVASFQRLTGASTSAIAKFAKGMKVATKDSSAATKELATFVKRTKEAGLTGRDLDVIMQEAGESAIFLGSKGGDAVLQYNNILTGAGAAAKSLGVSTEEMVGIAEKLQDPLGMVAVIGPTFGKSMEERLELLAGKATEWGEKIQELGPGSAGAEKYMYSLSMRLGVPFNKVSKMITEINELNKQYAKTGEGPLKNEQDRAAALKRITEEMQGAAGGSRDAEKSADKASNKIEETLTKLEKAISDLNKVLAQSSGSWSALAAGALSFGGSIIPLISKFGMLKKAGSWLISLWKGGGAAKTAVDMAETATQAGKLATNTAKTASWASKAMGWFKQLPGTSGKFATKIAESASWASKALGWFKQIPIPWGTVAKLGGKLLGVVGAVYSVYTDIHAIMKTAGDNLVSKARAELEIQKSKFAIAKAINKESEMAKGGTEMMTVAGTKESEEHVAKLAFLDKKRAEYVQEWKALALDANGKLRTDLDAETKARIALADSNKKAMEDAILREKSLLGLKEGQKDKDTEIFLAEMARYKANKDTTNMTALQVMNMEEQLKKAEAIWAKDAKIAEDKRKHEDEERKAMVAAYEMQKLGTGATVEAVKKKQEEMEKLAGGAGKLRSAMELLQKDPKKAAEIAARKALPEEPQKAAAVRPYSAVEAKMAALGQKATSPDFAATAPELVDARNKRKARSEPIVTSKITADTGRARERHNESLDEMKQSTNVLKAIQQKVAEGGMDELINILKTYLPRIADVQDTGLASTANQWVN